MAKNKLTHRRKKNIICILLFFGIIAYFSLGPLLLKILRVIEVFSSIRWIIAVVLITGLFFIGLWLTKKPKSTLPFARQELYLALQGVSEAVKRLKTKINTPDLESLEKEIIYITERFAIESEFGYGVLTVIECEKQISSQVQLLIETIQCITESNMNKKIEEMNMIAKNLNFLLTRRIELKKK